MNKSLEENLFDEMMKRLDSRRELIKEYIYKGDIPHEEYVAHVGSLRVLDGLEEDFTQLRKTFFPD